LSDHPLLRIKSELQRLLQGAELECQEATHDNVRYMWAGMVAGYSRALSIVEREQKREAAHD
jgi:hypothetical protein